jgi:hypothetical protein
MVLILAALVGLLAFFLLIFAQIAPELAEGVPILEKPVAYVFGAQQVAGQTWFPLILAVVMLGSEFGSTVWATALTRDPRRVSQISARFVILALASLLAIGAGIAGWSIVTAIAVPGEGAPGVSEWMGLVWKVALIELAWTAIGLGAVAMLRSVGPAIGAALALYFVDPILGLWGPWETVSLSAATTSLFQIDFAGGFGVTFMSNLSLPHAVAIVLGWTALGLVFTWWGLHRRDA